ncbi:sodium/glutamate symporter [Polymorphobacter fuscus]|uniref:Sodium/glutamate symporter n=1 Tax=Sandarakinorhabdus fusca TaxID=1439888 RepID=A0A7C9KHD3_9SPHN|nr:sodium/glutamate symporter [Polymorphobacter fuscus]MQT16361.1 sodium/glutamate symporter [Polymorphobacter fuscus]
MAVSAFLALTFGIIAYFIGAGLTRRVQLLSAYSIPEPVSGGIVTALVALAVVSVTGREIQYDLAARDALLVYFFTTIGLKARVSDLRRGGPVLAIMLALTLVYMVVQSIVGLGVARLFDLPLAAGVMLGTASLIGGHGTSIAWGPTITEVHGVAGGAELGIAMATVGLIVASVLGGPIAKFLIARGRLAPAPAAHVVVPTAAAPGPFPPSDLRVDHVGLMRSILWIQAAILLGSIAYGLMDSTGIKLPLFVPCLIAGILLSNLVPWILPDLASPAETPALGVVSEFSLSVFLSMSLMSMELWTLASSAGVLMVAITVQAIMAAVFIIGVVFPIMGRDYFAAVMAAGSTGLMLGATPTAIANMTAVTQRYGPAPLAFIVMPLVSAFFVDIANAVIIQWVLLFASR